MIESPRIYSQKQAAINKKEIKDTCLITSAFEYITRGILPMMAYTETFRPKGVPFSGFRYMKG